MDVVSPKPSPESLLSREHFQREEEVISVRHRDGVSVMAARVQAGERLWCFFRSCALLTVCSPDALGKSAGLLLMT